jgi:hypothetical protein
MLGCVRFTAQVVKNDLSGAPNELFCGISVLLGQLAGKIHRADHVLYFETHDILHFVLTILDQ